MLQIILGNNYNDIWKVDVPVTAISVRGEQDER